VHIVKLDKLTERELDGLGETLGGYDDYFIEAVESGICELWDINNGQSFSITRMEHDNFIQQTIMVVCCYKGEDLTAFVDHITAIADYNNWQIRFHTKRPGLVKWMRKSYNFNETEQIAIRNPNHG